MFLDNPQSCYMRKSRPDKIMVFPYHVDHSVQRRKRSLRMRITPERVLTKLGHPAGLSVLPYARKWINTRARTMKILKDMGMGKSAMEGQMTEESEYFPQHCFAFC